MSLKRIVDFNLKKNIITLRKPDYITDFIIIIIIYF